MSSLKGSNMSLREVLEKLAQDHEPVLLKDRRGEWEAGDLLTTLSAPMLRTRVSFLPGFYIAVVSDAGYLGEVLFRIKTKA
jgi:hypothetical protein